MAFFRIFGNITHRVVGLKSPQVIKAIRAVEARTRKAPSATLSKLYLIPGYGTRAQSQHGKRDLALLMSGAAGPVKPAPTGLRDAGLTIPPARNLLPLLTRRAGCHESGLSGSREALTSNPFDSEWSTNSALEGVIREFYPMELQSVFEVGRR